MCALTQHLSRKVSRSVIFVTCHQCKHRFGAVGTLMLASVRLPLAFLARLLTLNLAHFFSSPSALRGAVDQSSEPWHRSCITGGVAA